MHTQMKKYPLGLTRSSTYFTPGYFILKKGKGGIHYNNDAIKIKETLQDYNSPSACKDTG